MSRNKGCFVKLLVNFHNRDYVSLYICTELLKNIIMKKIIYYFHSLHVLLREIRNTCFQIQMLVHSIQSKIEEVEIEK